MTASPKAPSRPWYDDACGAAHALELLGERWALLVVRELVFGPRRFSELRHGLPGISANVLTQRLEGLEAASILVRRQLPSPTNAQVYELTPWGYEAEVLLQVMGRWAARSPSHDPSLPISAASVLLSFRTMLDPSRARGVTVTMGLVLGGESFVAQVRRGAIDIRRGVPEEPDATLTAEPTALAAAVYGGRSLAEAGIVVQGNRTAARTFCGLFTLPPKA